MSHKRRRLPQVYLSRPRPQEQGKYFTQREQELKDREAILSEKEHALEINRKLIDDTLHEIRKINNQINGGILNLSKSIDEILIDDAEFDRHIHNTLKTLDGNSTLLSTRMDAYDIMFNPTSVNRELDYMMSVFGKIEKVYKCLYTSKKAKNIEIHLNGRSEEKYRLRNSMELAFFIVIENAIKYSPEGESIDIDFSEDNDKLDVTFRNWAVCPQDEEMNHLTERGFRSKSVVNKGYYEGSGLGLYLLKQICQANDVIFEFDKRADSINIGGVEYHQFIVTLSFRNV